MQQKTVPAHKLKYTEIHRDIVEKCVEGNRSAQFELYRLYSKAMYNVALRIVKNEVDAEDVLQQSFIDIYTKIHTFKFQSSIGAWIKRIVVNNSINHHKKRKLDTVELNDWHKGELPDDGVFEMPSDNSWEVQRIQQAMMQLPDGYRVVFSLYLMEGYDHKEIAQILEITEATSKSQLSRAKHKLKQILQTL